jgi:hypothetical protein
MKAFIASLALIFAVAAFTSMWSLTDQPGHTRTVHMAVR